jgi:hypothetical protein
MIVVNDSKSAVGFIWTEVFCLAENLLHSFVVEGDVLCKDSVPFVMPRCALISHVNEYM